MPSRLLIVSFSVCPAPDRHGVELLNVLKALASRYSVDVLTLRSAELPYVERFMKTRMLRVPVGQGSLASQVEAFRRAIRRQLEGEEYDVVHLRSAWGGRAVVSGLAAAGSSARMVYEVARSTQGEPRAADEKLSAALADEELACLSRADLILVPTEGARAHLLGRGLGERVEVLPPGVDVDHFDWEPGPGEDGPPRVLYAGRLSAGRGVRLLIGAAGRLRRERRLKLMLAGPVESSFAPLLSGALAEAGLGAGDVDQLGPIEHDDMPRLIAQATVCVAPAAADTLLRPLAGFPSKLLEYMACRRAVAAPRRPAVEEVIHDGKDGLLFKPGDADELRSTLARLLDDEPLRERLAASGYEHVRSAHPASAVRRRLLEAYARLTPPSQWAPPAQSATPIDALPSHPDTTTARRAVPWLADGRAEGELSGEIIIDSQPVEIPVLPGEIVIEAVDFETAGEAYDARLDEETPSSGTPLTPGAGAEVDHFMDEQHTQPFGTMPRDPDAPPAATSTAPADDKPEAAVDADEKTRPGPLRTR